MPATHRTFLFRAIKLASPYWVSDQHGAVPTCTTPRPRSNPAFPPHLAGCAYEAGRWCRTQPRFHTCPHTLMRMMPRAQMMLTTAMLCQVVGVVANLLLPRHAAQCHP